MLISIFHDLFAAADLFLHLLPHSSLFLLLTFIKELTEIYLQDTFILKKDTFQIKFPNLNANQKEKEVGITYVIFNVLLPICFNYFVTYLNAINYEKFPCRLQGI